MRCICCQSGRVVINPFKIQGYYSCGHCGLIFTVSRSDHNEYEDLKVHYRQVDPHKKVADSKQSFFNRVLDYLSVQIKTDKKRILDIGCGHGYFLEMAAKRGWDVSGVEIFRDAAHSAREKVGEEKIFRGLLKESCFSDNSFDAITMWDVIAIVDNPFENLQECYRIIIEGGKLGIRTRNVFFQKILYLLYLPLKSMADRCGIKIPYVFNRYCFSGKSLSLLLSRMGFINIQITNSPLTSGDPYGHLDYHFAVRVSKAFIDCISKFVFWISGGRYIIGPSLLVWAEKPQWCPEICINHSE